MEKQEIMIGKIFRHYKEGNLLTAVKFKLNNWFDARIERQEKEKLESKPLHRFYIRNTDEAYEFLYRQAKKYSAESGNKKSVVLFGDPTNPDSGRVFGRLKEDGIPVEILPDYNSDQKELNPRSEGIACFISLYLREKLNHQLCVSLLRDEKMKNIPFEYLGDTHVDFLRARKQDHQHSFEFVSPILISNTDFFDIYEESLSRFEKKCDIRDYMDLCQLISSVIEREIPGDIAEFGSYKGHSGYLISRLLKEMGSGKSLFMFDTFEKFPSEDAGVDSFWSDTHEVNFDEVRSKFTNNDKVKLIRGDFTKTLDGSGITKLSFIYIDCDSYRATTYLMEKLFDEVLSPGGLLVLEDYGHPALLGNRIAFHQFMEKRKNNFRFFSQFSGFQIVVK